MNYRTLPQTDDRLIRPQNERLILDLVRRNTELSKAQIARASKLSAQSATVIVNRLVDEGLLMSGKAVRGKVGQPSTPYRLNPLGAASVGIKVGRRSAEIATMALDYSIIEHRAIRYEYPDYDQLCAQLCRTAANLIEALPQKQADAIQGIGLAVPDALWSWETLIGAPAGAMAAWENANLSAPLERALGFPVQAMNDASAACLASLRLGAGRRLSSMVYFYVGTFVGGGLTFGDQVFEGFSGNAGAIGSLPTHMRGAAAGGQLLEHASLHSLEVAMRGAGYSAESLYTGTLDPGAEEIFRRWLSGAADALAFATLAGQAFVDPEGIVIDTSLAPQLRTQLIDAINAALGAFDQRGLRSFEVRACEVGIHARSLGSALLPYQPQLPDQGQSSLPQT
ncbi:MAG: ROK family transcriptional regulator [Pseudomonadota bacterium]